MKPQYLTLYTLEPRNEIIKNYKLIPDPNGNVLVFENFWHGNNHEKNIVPTILAYADIVNQNDRRLTETAQKLFDGYLQN